ncbi:MAG: MFS transporter [Lapillicoccus sp.]
MTTSMFGDSVMLLVLSMWVKSLTGSNGQAGLTFFWMTIPALFAPIFGMFLDRVRPKPLLVWGSIASAAAVLPLTLVRDAGDVWIIWVVAFLYGISFIVLPAALNGLLKELVPEDQLVLANSSLQTVKEGFRLVGPLIGAALFAGFGGWTVALLDAASFLAAAAVISTIAVTEERPVHERQDWWAEMTGGMRHLAHDPILRHTLVAFGLMLLVLGFTEASIYAIVDVFGRPVEFVSVIVTVQGVGAILGGLSATWWVRRIGEVGAIAVGLVVLTLGLAIVAATSHLAVFLVAVPIVGYSIPLLIVAFMTLVQRRTPLRLMGRVSTSIEVVMGGPQAISLAVGALLVTLLDYHLIFLVMAVVTGSAVAYLGIALGRSVFGPIAAYDGAMAATAVASTASPLDLRS